jgi:hypothetical protein
MHSVYYKIYRDYKKVYKTILSCECKEHLDAVNKFITLYYIKYDDVRLLERLEKRYIKKKQEIWC